MPRIYVHPKTMVCQRVNMSKTVSSVEESLKNLSLTDPNDLDAIVTLAKGLSRAITAQRKIRDLEAKGFVETKTEAKVEKKSKLDKTTK